MASETDFILRGPPVGPIPDCSLGEYLIGKMRSLPQDRIIQVEGDTGATQTVGELLEMGARVSTGLRNLGLEAGDVVLMLCRNCLDTTAIVLGSWLSAAVIVPLAVNMKIAEIKHALELTQPKFIFLEAEAVTNTTAAVDLLSMSPTVILVGDPYDKKPHHSVGVAWKTFQDILPEVDVGTYVPQSVKSPSTELVAIVFSSGTSGLPKGVGITHANLVFQDLNIKRVIPFDTDTDYIQISQFFWITAHFFFILTLTTGMKRVLLRVPSAIDVLKTIHQYKPKWAMLAPVFALSITNHVDFEKFDVSSMKYLVVGGSPLTPSVGEKLKEKWKSSKLIQCYGTTELTGTICITDDETDVYSLGRVTPGLQLKVVDVGTGKPLQPNALGEIRVKSPGAMRGYVKNEEATREVMDEEGWVRTGDLGYYDESRQVYMVDRIKEVVKIMNMQIAPTEVENVILSIPGVLEAYVTGVTDDGDVCKLVALVVRENGSAVTEEVIREQVAGTLSDYKQLKGGVFFVKSFPKTLSGKLKRGEIRKLAQELYSNKTS